MSLGTGSSSGPQGFNLVALRSFSPAHVPGGPAGRPGSEPRCHHDSLPHCRDLFELRPETLSETPPRGLFAEAGLACQVQSQQGLIKMSERVPSLSGMSGALWKGAHGCWLLCVQSTAYEEPVKFPTKTRSWQTVRNSSVQFLSALHPSAQTTGGGGEVDGVGFRVCTHGGKWPGVRWRNLTAHT